MEWYQYIACFFAGAFSANVVPHFVAGIQGNKFPTPFAKPPGKGLSSATVNMTWALFNMLVATLFFKSGHMDTGHPVTLVVFFAGVSVLSLGLSKRFTGKHHD
ncbi:hypothetical protein [Mucilaginibacter jinjuensis]|uniref:PQ loop repeat protein n=1 Tax=Mucilaginibacter jinjuensis TaxID=1176721 RepID=A0ABY7TAB7_9SPHI|nr:hypothetical protein [Mucilaginibacter jinjuensis]WCT13248.1 hypothetical protein PQO05_04800 [Mucilaginibacter jinjuensis]